MVGTSHGVLRDPSLFGNSQFYENVYLGQDKEGAFTVNVLPPIETGVRSLK